MCDIIGFPPIFTNGLGVFFVASPSLVPKPPDKITTFTGKISYILLIIFI